MSERDGARWAAWNAVAVGAITAASAMTLADLGPREQGLFAMFVGSCVLLV